MRRRNAEAPIIIKRGKKHKHGFHGGNWKVALADFMTSMFIFCLAMWLINITTEEQKLGIADWIAPTAVSQSESGSGGVLGGINIIADGAQRTSGGPPAVVAGAQGVPLDVAPDDADGMPSGSQDADIPFGREDPLFEDILTAIRDINEMMPTTADGETLLVDRTAEGLRITLRDLEGEPMFASGSAQPLPRTREVLQELVPILQPLQNRIKIVGHTDAVPYASGDLGYSNWELSADRANAARRTLVAAGLPGERMTEVTGQAATEPFNPGDPRAAENRRLEIVLMNTPGAPAIELGEDGLPRQAAQQAGDAGVQVRPEAGVSAPAVPQDSTVPGLSAPERDENSTVRPPLPLLQ